MDFRYNQRIGKGPGPAMSRHREVPLLTLAVFCILVTISSVLGIAQNPETALAPAGRIGAIDESSLVTLDRNRHFLANASNDRGEVSPDLPMERMLLVLQRAATSESALERLIAAQQDKSSPSFHAWLTPEQFAAQFAPASVDLQKLTAWLTSHNFRVNRVARGGMTIEFRGTAAQVKEAFHTAIHSYVVNGAHHYANSADPQIPAALAPVVAGISTLHNFQKQAPVRVLGTATRIANTSAWQPNFTFNGPAGSAHYLAPGDFAKIYNSAPLYKAGTDGTGQSIAIVGRNNINLSDVQIFRIAFGLPANDPQIILDGPDPGNLFGSSEETEADLDVEWSGAIAPKAAIKFVISASTNTTDGADLSALYIVDNNLAPVISTSFGQCEAKLGQAANTFYNNLWQQATAQGITVVVSSGDNAAAGCDSPSQGVSASQGPAVNGLASTPYNIAVGGSEFNENGANGTYWSTKNGPDQSSVLSYIPEQVWNESCADPNQCGFISLFASSGGASNLYTKPSWQVAPGVPNDGKRDLPDVSLAAAAQHDGFLLCQDGLCITDSNGQLIGAEVVGGTSASTPTFAALMALVVQNTNSRQGQANFVLYPLAAAENPANCNASGPPQSQCIFNDITQGNNNVAGQAGVSAGPGYDMATGLGSINAANLVSNWHNVTFRGTKSTLTLTRANITHGQPVNASAAVAPAIGAGMPTGGVSLLSGSENVNLGVLNNGSISSSVANLPGGSYSVTASYGGDSNFATSISSPVPITVAPESSTTTFSVGGSPTSISTTYSAVLPLQAVVAGASGQGFPTGNVVISDTFNGTTATLMTVSLNSEGNLTASEFSLPPGSHALNAAYSGDSSFQPSSAGPVTVGVAKGPTQTVLSIPTGAMPSTSVTLQAIVFAAAGVANPTGTLQFFDGGKALGSPVQVQNLVATLSTTQLSSGSNSITATYSGDSNFTSSTSTAANVIVGNPNFQLAVNPGNLAVSSSTPGTATVFIAPGPGLGFVGPVSFSCSGLPAGTSCSFQPAQVTLDGFTPTTTKLTIAKIGTASLKSSGLLQNRRPLAASSLGILTALCLFLLPWPGNLACRRKSNQWFVSVLFVLLVAGALGCGGGGSASSPPPSSSGPTATSSVVSVAGTGGTGAQAVSQSVTLSVIVQ
jgi:hypothetical protein